MRSCLKNTEERGTASSADPPLLSQGSSFYSETHRTQYICGCVLFLVCSRPMQISSNIHLHLSCSLHHSDTTYYSTSRALQSKLPLGLQPRWLPSSLLRKAFLAEPPSIPDGQISHQRASSTSGFLSCSSSFPPTTHLSTSSPIAAPPPRLLTR